MYPDLIQFDPHLCEVDRESTVNTTIQVSVVLILLYFKHGKHPTKSLSPESDAPAPMVHSYPTAML